MNKSGLDILIFNYSDSEGSGNFVFKIMSNLISKGFTVNLVVAKKNRDDKNIVKYLSQDKFNFNIQRKVEKKLNLYSQKYEFHNRGKFLIKSAKCFNFFFKKKPKIIICAWTSLLISLETVSKISKYHKSKLYLWPLDKAHFFGGCHYNITCNNYISGCKNCPAVPFYKKKLPRNIFKNNSELSKNFTLIYHSPWLKNYIKSLKHLNFNGFEFYSTSFKKFDLINTNSKL
jgi:hypothetical protein